MTVSEAIDRAALKEKLDALIVAASKQWGVGSTEHNLVRDISDAVTSMPPLAALSKPIVSGGDVAERVKAAAVAHADFVAKRDAMNAARPDSTNATRAEYALYDERYKADHEAEREHWRTAIRLAQVADQIAAAPAILSSEGEGEREKALAQALDDLLATSGARGHFDARCYADAVAAAEKLLPRPSKAPQ